MARVFISRPTPPSRRPRFAWWVDALIFLAVIAVAAGVVALAARAARPLTPQVEIDLGWSALPTYAASSTLRMAAAYLVAATFSLAYARLAVTSRTAERILIPLLDILQSIPILSFMPAVVLALVAAFPDRNLGLELLPAPGGDQHVLRKRHYPFGEGVLSGARLQCVLPALVSVPSVNVG